MTVEGSQPTMARLINVDDSMNLRELAHVIDAAFGFSGAASHVYTSAGGAGGTPRAVYTSFPGAGEGSENDVTVERMGAMTYVYDPSANWNIHVEVLGLSRLDGPTPMLIDVLGPDVVESCNGPELMHRFHSEARRIAAGLDPDMEVAPLLLSFLPVMTPERLLQRLTQADPVTVSERVSFVAEDLFLDTTSRVDDDPRAPQFAAEFDEFLETRPDLREILHNDPNPERNPALIAAMAEFFEERLNEQDGLNAADVAYAAGMFETATSAADVFNWTEDYVGDGEDEVYRALTAVVREVWDQPDHRVKLTSSGYLPPSMVANLARQMNLGVTAPHPRERSLPQLQVVRRVLAASGALTEAGGWVGVGTLGEALLSDKRAVVRLHAELRAGFEHVIGAGEWRVVVRWVADEYAIIPSGPHELPGDVEKTRALLRAIGVLDEVDDGGLCITPGGAAFVERMLGINEDEE